ncbi:hypothetical protein MAR_006096 [Mya arenaria]|uniref:Chitin-binding type-2 domain-containing protein n=1 Tax=Mya arenaria TaxID=6604 RepID=A0ABY7DB97_MYAAR|nr:hypothetical protein MAR_006096 [Mya arenaria]
MILPVDGGDGQCDEKTAGRFPHPDECQLYYDCSVTYSPPEMPGGKGVTECEYPLLYDESSGKCMKEVECGSRMLKKNGCDYYNNRCYSIRCPPCFLRFPECEGLTDGTYPHPAKPGTPRCMVCKNERFVEEIYCPVNVITT